MPQPPVAEVEMPPIPAETVQEGARWRHHAPSGEQVAAWFSTVPLDEDFKQADYVGGIVIIPQSVKVKYSTSRGQQERYEMTYTPYMQIGTRLAYARHLAEKRDLILRIGPAKVPRSENTQSPYFNGNLVDGLWWHVITSDRGEIVRFLCATQVVQMFEREEYAKAQRNDEGHVIWESIMPVLEGQGTKQVGGGADMNGIMKAQTGATGRALGVAGILVLGTGIATAEDMQEFTASPAAAPELPSVDAAPSQIAPGSAPTVRPEDRLVQLRHQVLAGQAKLDEEFPEEGSGFSTWWKTKREAEGWSSWGDVPVDALEGIVQRLENTYQAAVAARAAEAPEIV